MQQHTIDQAYEMAKERYAEFGVDTDAAIRRADAIAVSMHCWQGDDVIGFDGSDTLTGGIQTTGNYKGRARTPRSISGTHRFMMRMEKLTPSGYPPKSRMTTVKRPQPIA
jgi:L-rhamnose isomerase